MTCPPAHPLAIASIVEVVLTLHPFSSHELSQLSRVSVVWNQAAERVLYRHVIVGPRSRGMNIDSPHFGRTRAVTFCSHSADCCPFEQGLSSSCLLQRYPWLSRIHTLRVGVNNFPFAYTHDCPLLAAIKPTHLIVVSGSVPPLRDTKWRALPPPMPTVELVTIVIDQVRPLGWLLDTLYWRIDSLTRIRVVLAPTFALLDKAAPDGTSRSWFAPDLLNILIDTLWWNSRESKGYLELTYATKLFVLDPTGSAADIGSGGNWDKLETQYVHQVREKLKSQGMREVGKLFKDDVTHDDEEIDRRVQDLRVLSYEDLLLDGEPDVLLPHPCQEAPWVM